MEGVPLFSGKMDIDAIMDWLEDMENQFECEGILEAQKVKVAKSRIRGSNLTWWKYVQDERVNMGKNRIANCRSAMENRIKENFLPGDF